ncbi:MAG: hypothetical protein M1816_002348 [Peltula sp. TS41687]|nr:MAG: hypothetical protein M1816_002348 [Peltula sp. TS41687]
MAYPFPRHGETPETPQELKGMGSPRSSSSSPSRRARSVTSIIRLAVGLGLVTFFLVYLSHVLSKKKSSSRQLDRIPYHQQQHGADIDYFTHFEGHQDCGISSQDLYVPPSALAANQDARTYPFCKNRASLLEAMSEGGRHGFDTPFFPKGCHYRWYTTEEICMILERFDGIFFIGDSLVQHIYTAFNILLRENIALGGLRQWDMSSVQLSQCRCENQFVKDECVSFAVAHNDEVSLHDAQGGHPSPYLCNRTPHIHLPLSSTDPTTAQEHHATLTTHLSSNPDSYRPIPIIVSVSLSTALRWPDATAAMDEWVRLADSAVESSSAARTVPFLWLGPVAAGHLKPPGQILAQGNNALWHYTVEMAREAKARGLDVLDLYNLTLQATSWDGSAYGSGVAVVQAMMVINWLARLETT